MGLDIWGVLIVLTMSVITVLQQWQIVNLLRIDQEERMALADDLADIRAQLEKARAEVVSKINDLEIALASAGATSPEVVAVVDELKAVAQSLDDVVADADEAPVSE